MKITASNNKFRVNETGVGGNGVILVTVAAGEYYLHRDATYHSDLPSLFLAIEAALSASIAANGYKFEPATPTESVDAGGAGMRFGVDSTIEFELTAGHADFTMDPAWFGLRAQTYNAVENTTWSVTGDYCLRPLWRTVHQLGGYASSKRSFEEVKVNESHDDPEDRYAIVWRERKYRRVSYPYVPAGNIFQEHVAADFYAAGERGTGDTGGVFEHVWKCLAENRKVIVVHNRDVWDWQLEEYCEVVRLRKLQPSIESSIRASRTQGELYEVNLEVAILNSSLPGYPH